MVAIDYNKIIQDINKNVFSDESLTKNIIINHYSESTNAMNETITLFTGQDPYTGVVLDYYAYKAKYDKTGKYNDSSFILLLPYNTPIESTDTILYGTDEYSISHINDSETGYGKVLRTLFVRIR